MSGQSQTWEGTRRTTTWWCQAPGQGEHTREPKASTKANRTKTERKAAESNKMRDCKPPPNTQIVHIVQMAFDVHGRWSERAEVALKQASRRRLEKRDVVRATRSERTLGALLGK